MNTKMRVLSLAASVLSGLHGSLLWLAGWVSQVRQRVWTVQTKENLRTVNTRYVIREITHL